MADPFNHDSGELKANVKKFKVCEMFFYAYRFSLLYSLILFIHFNAIQLSDLVVPENITIGSVPGESLKITAHNVSFRAEFEWQDAMLLDADIEDGHFSAQAREVQVSVTTKITRNNGKPSLEVLSCEVSMPIFNLQSGKMLPFMLVFLLNLLVMWYIFIFRFQLNISILITD